MAHSLNLLKRLLTNRLPRVVLKGQTSNWKEILAGLTQDSILVLFFIYLFMYLMGSSQTF